MLLTGASGFLGRELLKRLKGARCPVRKSAGVKGKFVWDITDRNSVAQAVSGSGVVVHAAAVVRGSRSDYERVNVEGTRNLVEAAVKARVRHFIFVSTILAAYEKTTAYGRSKLAAEEIVRNSGLPFTIFRVSIMYGRHDTLAIGRLASIVRKSPVVPLIGFGNCLIQPVYVGDVAAAIAVAAKSRPRNKTYYLTGLPVSLRSIVQEIASQLGIRRLFVPFPYLLLKTAVFFLDLTRSAFNPSQLDFLAAGRVFDCGEAERDFKFSPIGIRKGLRLAL
jgi:NADH dehydrogenase